MAAVLDSEVSSALRDDYTTIIYPLASVAFGGGFRPRAFPTIIVRRLISDQMTLPKKSQYEYDEDDEENVEVREGDVVMSNQMVHDVTQVEDYLIDTSEECEVIQIEPEIVIALNEGENEMNINVNSDKPEMPQIEREEDQPIVLVQPPTLPCTFGTPYKGVKIRERLQIFNTTDTFVLDDPDTIDSFVLEVPDELLNLKDGVHASLPKYVDALFVVDISKGEGIT
ncbi:hypothetical protein Syun_012777 [Stephania yunnanensis]|uniref:Uncharacterized protein n=1 Tax=Stephania yunnanensis TaxID=152371 RepID=A0AAP0PGP8_9MAGN